jgi:hypothetical protein
MGRIVLGVAVAACVALAGTAGAQVKGAGKSSITIVKVPAPGPTTPTPKTAGSVSSKAAATVAGKPPTGGGSFALKLSKDVGDPAKPGFPDGEYVLEIESAGTPTGNLVGDPISAAYFITLTVSLGKCTIHDLASVDPNGGMCGGAMQPVCALPDQAGKCSASIYQVAGNALATAGLVANQPFGARFRIRANPTPATCHTGDLLLNSGVLAPPTSTCRTGTVLGVGGVALGTTS